MSDIRTISDEVNKALVQEMTGLIHQAHQVLQQQDAPADAKQALWSFGNFIAAKAILRLEAVSDAEWMEESTELKAELTRLAAIHGANFQPILKVGEQEVSDGEASE